METRILHGLGRVVPDWSVLRQLGLDDDLLGSLVLVDPVETWEGDSATVRATGVVDGSASFELMGLTMVAGFPEEGVTGVDVLFRCPSPPLFALLGAVALDNGLTTVDDLEADARRLGIPGTLDFSNPAALLTPLRIEISGLRPHLELPRTVFQLGRRVRAQGRVTSIEPHPDDPPLRVPLPSVRVALDTDTGVSVSMEDPTPLSLPPLMFRGSGLGLEMDDVSVDLSDTASPPGVADPTWRGLAAGAVRVWGLDSLLPFLPARIEQDDPAANVTFSDWRIGSAGIEGQVVYEQTPPDDLWALRELALRFDDDWIPTELTAACLLRVAQVDSGLSELGDESHLEVLATLRYTPEAEPDARLGFDLVLRSPVASGEPLVAWSDRSHPAATRAVLPALAGLLFLTTETEAGLVTAALAGLEAAGLLTVERFALNALRFSHRPVQHGEQWVPTLEAHLDLAVDVRFTGDPVSSETPIGLGFTGVSLAWSLGPDAALPRDVKRVSVAWDLSLGLAVTLQARASLGGGVTLSHVRLSRDASSGLLLELGLAASGEGAAAVLPVPDAVTFVFDDRGRLVDVRVALDLPFVLLVPGVLYAHGRLGNGGGAGVLPPAGGLAWDEPRVGRLDGYLIGNGTARELSDHMKPESYMLAFELGLLHATREDGLTAVVVTLDGSFVPGIPLGTSGASIYGLGLTFAQNAAPAAIGGDYADWYMEQPRAFSTDATKWTVAPGEWGFGASAVVGSTPDDGKSWNAKVGLFILLPGPVIMLVGQGGVFSRRPSAGDSGPAPFAAVIVLDLRDSYLSVDLRLALDLPKDADVVLVEVRIPAEVFVNLDDPSDFRLYLGRFAPADERVTVRSMLFDLSSYLMLDGSEIRGLPVADPLPGLALAFGGATEVRWGFDGSVVACFLYAGFSFDMGVSLAGPVLLSGQIRLEGGLVVRAFGLGFELGVFARFAGLAPKPFRLEGEIGIVIATPWPFDDIRASARFAFGPGGDLPPAPSPFAGLTAHDRSRKKPVELERWSSGDPVPELPVDPVFTLAFEAPMGNLDRDWTSFASNGSDGAGRVWKLVTTSKERDGGVERQVERGYRYELTDLVLEDVTSGSALTGLTALWEPGVAQGNTGSAPGAKAAGGQAARTQLQLMDFDGFHLDRYVGVGGQLSARRIQGWDPCSLLKVHPTLTYRFDAMSLGPVGPAGRRVHPSLPPMIARSVPASTVARAMRHAGAMGHVEASVSPLDLPQGAAPTPLLSDPTRILTLPAALLPLRVTPDVELSPDALRVVQDAADQVDLILPEHVGLRVWVLAAPDVRIEAVGVIDGQVATDPLTLVPHVTDFALQRVVDAQLPADRGWSVFQIQPPVRLDALRFRSVRPAESVYIPDPLGPLAASVLQLVVTRGDHVRSGGDFTSELFSELVRQDQAGNLDQLHVLEPGHTYELRATVEAHHARRSDDDDLRVGDPAGTHHAVYRFRTPADVPTAALRGGTTDDPRDDTWDVYTEPSGGQPPFYYGDSDIHIRFRRSHIPAVYDRYGKRPALRLVDERGHDQFAAAELIAGTASDLPVAAAEWRDRIAGAPCFPDDAERLWKEVTADVASLLEPATRYRARLHLVDASVPDLATVDFSSVPSVYEWEFVTSRYLDAAEHLAAFEIFDEVATMRHGSGDLATLVAGVSANDAVLDPVLLDRVLFEGLGLGPRPTPDTPEAIRIWTWDPASGASELVALVLDSPEALIRRGGSVEAVGAQGRPEPGRWIGGVQGARLIFVPDGPIGGTVNLVVGAARRAIDLPAVPPVLVG